MNTKNLNRMFGFIALLVSFAVYALTVQDTVPFWDCSEFSGSSVWQQVPHPPGAPLFLMVGKLFHMLIPFGDPGWRLNMISVVCSAITVFLLYHITVKVILNFRDQGIETMGEAVTIFGSALVAALAYTFSDTFWFNAVESEVYAAATLFVALVIYLIMRWNEEADNPGHERYLLLIAYMIGLSTGVHLLAILTIISLVGIVYFRKYTFTIPSFLIACGIAVVTLLTIYPGVVKWLPAYLAGHTAGRNDAHEFAIENSPLLILLALSIIGAAIFGFWYGWKNNKPLVKLVTSAFILIILGYTSYTHILIRANSNPPMNENMPTDFAKLSSYLGREQYGNDDSWPRRVKTEDYFIQRYNSKDENGEYIYGEWIPPGRKEVQRKDGSAFTVASFEEINTGAELAYLWKYQMNHMYWRYFAWNFIGRTSDEQDAPSFETDRNKIQQLNYKTGYAHLFPIKFYALPFIFGLIGLILHFSRNPRMALNFFWMFLMMGVIAAVAQQQQDPQPRERDYFYTGSFLIWAVYIGIGVYAIIEMLSKTKFETVKSAAVVALAILLVPVNMAVGGWRLHDRTGNLIPFDYSYNILQSTEENAILFTNGDNDTFPLWYLQDVMGVRRDVRIVNLSLGNTLWYIDQLKNQRPWGANKVPLTFADDSLRRDDEVDPRALSYDFGEALNLEIPVKKEILAQYTKDTAALRDGNFRATFVGKDYGKQGDKQMYLFRVQDKLVLNILRTTKFERPVYFSNTVGPDAFCGLEPYFRFEGMAMRICPVKQKNSSGENVNLDIMEKCLMHVDNTPSFSTTPKYGFKFRNLNNLKVYYDPTHRRLTGTYRQLFLSYAQALVTEKKDTAQAVKALDMMNEMISPKQFPMTFDFEAQLARLYNEFGAKQQASVWVDYAISSCQEMISNPTLRPEYTNYEISGQGMGPFRTAARMYEMKKDYNSAKNVLQKLLSSTEAVLKSSPAGNQMSEETGRLYGSIIDIRQSFDDYELKPLIEQKKYSEARKLAIEKYNKYFAESSIVNSQLAGGIMNKIYDLNKKLGLPDSSMK